jgi:peptide/nickel transport system substrate-binding protein
MPRHERQRNVESEPVSDRRLTRGVTRRDFLRGIVGVGISFAPLSTLLAACGSGDGAPSGPSGASSTATAEVERTLIPQPGGTLQVALTGDPPNLDLTQTTDSNVMLVTAHIHETLFTWDAEYRPAPLLAAAHEVSEDGLLHRLELRRGVRFHTGVEMLAADVIASIERWGANSSLGKSMLEAVEEIVEVDASTLEFRMLERFGTFEMALARQLQGCAIYPKSVLDASEGTRLSDYVGTGPYRFVDWQPDRRIRVERFSDYQPADGEPNGYAGGKQQYLDAIEFVPVRTEAARVAGMQSGTFHILETISPDQVPVLIGSPAVSVDVLPADSWLNAVLNLRSPLLSDLRVRRAIQIALDHAAIMQASVGEGYYELTPELVPGAPAWYSEAGSEHFNRNDPEEARRLLAEVGYDGTPLRFLATTEIQQEYNAALTMKQQLEAVGLVVDVQVFDGAALSERRNDESSWEMYCAWASFRPDPVMRNLSASATGWWGDEEKDRLLSELQAEADYDKRFALWEQVQRRFYEDVPRLKIGNSRRVLARSIRLHGIGPTEMQPDFSNAWLGD